MATTGYVKISKAILASSVWCETPATRVVWLTMLALADAHWFVDASIPAIARLAGVTRLEAENAVLALCAQPYPDAAIWPEAGGFRVKEIPGLKIRKGRESLSRHIKRAVWARDKGRCVQCAATEDIEYDHILAVAHGGENSIENIQLLCRPCNRVKGPKAWEERRQA